MKTLILIAATIISLMAFSGCVTREIVIVREPAYADSASVAQDSVYASHIEIHLYDAYPANPYYNYLGGVYSISGYYYRPHYGYPSYRGYYHHGSAPGNRRYSAPRVRTTGATRGTVHRRK